MRTLEKWTFPAPDAGAGHNCDDGGGDDDNGGDGRGDEASGLVVGLFPSL